MNNSDNKDKQQQEKRENIIEMGIVRTFGRRGNICTITIVGQIEGHVLSSEQNKTTKYEHIIPQIVSVEEDKEIDGLLILLNTVGGDVEAGLAISELISGMSKPSVSVVIGGGHSIGVPLAVSTDYSFIAPSATMTVHPIRMGGMIIGVEQTFDYFKKTEKRVVDFVVSNSGITEENFRELMLKKDDMANDVGSILSADQAVNYRLINEKGSLSAALDKLNELIKTKK